LKESSSTTVGEERKQGSERNREIGLQKEKKRRQKRSLRDPEGRRNRWYRKEREKKQILILTIEI